MQTKIQRERFEKYGSFLFCPERSCLCFGRETDAECKYESCILDDPEYQAMQARIAENQRKNHERQVAEQREEHAKPRRQTKTAQQILEEKIEQKENYARACYKANKPKKGDAVLHEVMILQAQLRKMKGA